MEALIEFGDCYQQFITDILEFQQKQAQVKLKMNVLNFKIGV